MWQRGERPQAQLESRRRQEVQQLEESQRLEVLLEFQLLVQLLEGRLLEGSQRGWRLRERRKGQKPRGTTSSTTCWRKRREKYTIMLIQRIKLVMCRRVKK